MKKFIVNTFRLACALLSLVRGVMVLCMLAVFTMTVYFISVAARVTIDQYNETLVWKDTGYGVPLAEVEPALLSNMADAGTVDAAEALDALEQYLEGLDGMSIPDRQLAESLLSEASKWKETYGLGSGTVDRLSLYLELEDAIPEAYATLDTGRLQSLGNMLYDMEMEDQTISGQQYMERLKGVSADFVEAGHAMSGTIWSAGTVRDGIWAVPYTYGREEMTGILDRLRPMEKFPAIQAIAGMLSDSSTVLNQNKNTRDMFAYHQFMDIVSNVDRSSYVPVSSIYTYGQALTFGCNVEVWQQDGYTVSLDSPVSGIYHDGERLEGDEYVRKGTELTVTLDEIYEPIPEEPDDWDNEWDE